MFTVALIGPDGAGKTTVSERLAETLPLRLKLIYMGVNFERAAFLPTSRLVRGVRRARARRPDTARGTLEAGPATGIARGVRRLRPAARLANLLGEEWLRQSVVWYHTKLWRTVALFDRHFYLDYYHHDIAATDKKRPLTDRIHGAILEHVYPKPDLVIVLDAPADVMWARKPETPIDWLERRRHEYLELAERLPRSVVVDAARPVDEVVEEVGRCILDFANERRPLKAGAS